MIKFRACFFFFLFRHDLLLCCIERYFHICYGKQEIYKVSSSQLRPIYVMKRFILRPIYEAMQVIFVHFSFRSKLMQNTEDQESEMKSRENNAVNSGGGRYFEYERV